jgi:hypothetical protein
LLDTGADICLVRSSVLLGDTEFDPQKRVKVKSLEGSIIETHGFLELNIHEGTIEIPFPFHLVSKQVELVYDGIMGRDFLQHTKARVGFGNNTVTFRKNNEEWTERIFSGTLVKETKGSRKLTLPKRTETIVVLPVEEGTQDQVGIIEKSEITEGVYIASSLTRVINDHVITSVLNTRDTEVTTSVSLVFKTPTVRLEKYNWEETGNGKSEGYVEAVATVRKTKVKNRIEEVQKKLRLNHLNTEEKKIIEKTCHDYQDIFYLPGEKLSCTNAARHTIQVVPFTTPINTRPYRLPETQKAEVENK